MTRQVANNTVVNSEVADLCRTAYVYFRRLVGDDQYVPGPRWDGGEYHGKRYRSIWPKVAAFVCKHQVNPVNWVRFHFLTVRNGDRPPFPTDLLNARLLEEFKASYVPNVEQITAEWYCQCQSALKEIRLIAEDYQTDPRTAIRMLLASRAHKLSPLFAYCLASQISAGDLAEQFFVPALMQFCESPEAYLSSQWRMIIPDVLKRYVQKS